MANYAPQILSIGTDISYSQYQQIIALLSKKANLNENVAFYLNINEIGSNEIATDDLKDNQLVFDFATKGAVMKILNGENIGTYVGGTNVG